MRTTTGAQLGVFTILGLIGQGGMGKVYRARDGRLKREVAIKVLPDGLADGDRVARFHREAEILATLSHQHIAAIYVHRLSDSTTTVIRGSVNPTSPSFSPDGASVVFGRAGQGGATLWRAAAEGGEAEALCSVPQGAGEFAALPGATRGSPASVRRAGSGQPQPAEANASSR